MSFVPALRTALVIVLCARVAFEPPIAFAQSVATPATGDTRKVTEPGWPTICAKVKATKWSVMSTAYNLDPFNATASTPGVLGSTGGTDDEPSNSATSYVATESEDNTSGAALQTALNSCPAGQAVELIPGDLGQNAIVMAPFHLSNSSGAGVGLQVDAGTVTYASLIPGEYASNCGKISTTGNTPCGGNTYGHWITASNTTGAGIYGPGVLNARGWDCFISSAGVCASGYSVGASKQSFYYQRILTYYILHGSAIEGSPTVPSGQTFTCNNTSAKNDCRTYGPNAVNLYEANNFTFYKATIRNAGGFSINWEGYTAGANGLTIWDCGIYAPHEVSNTDGIDPIDGINVTVYGCRVSVGDNRVAIKAKYHAAGNMSFLNNQGGAGIGWAIGYDQELGISNILFDGIQESNNLYMTTHATGLLLNSSSSNAGDPVDRVTYRHFCLKNEYNTMEFAVYKGAYTNILLQDGTELPSDQPGFTPGKYGRYGFSGLSTAGITMQMDNVTGGTGQGLLSTTQYISNYWGPGPVSSYLQSIFTASGLSGVSHTNAISTSPAPYCSASSYQPIHGELNLYTAASANNQTLNSTGGFTLQATLQPATAINTREGYVPSQVVHFYDNGVQIGTASIATGTYLASLPVAGPISAGTHTYTASYYGDTNYPAYTSANPYTFGPVTVTNGTAGTGGIKFGGTLKLGGTLQTQ